MYLPVEVLLKTLSENCPVMESPLVMKSSFCSKSSVPIEVVRNLESTPCASEA